MWSMYLIVLACVALVGESLRFLDAPLFARVSDRNQPKVSAVLSAVLERDDIRTCNCGKSDMSGPPSATFEPRQERDKKEFEKAPGNRNKLPVVIDDIADVTESAGPCIVGDARKQLKQGAIEGLTDEVIKTCINHLIPGSPFALMMKTVLSDLVTTSILKNSPALASSFANVVEQDIPGNSVKAVGGFSSGTRSVRDDGSINETDDMRQRKGSTIGLVGQSTRHLNAFEGRCLTISLTVPPQNILSEERGPYPLLLNNPGAQPGKRPDVYDHAVELTERYNMGLDTKIVAADAQTTRRLQIQAIASVARFFVVPLICHSLAHALPSSSIHMAFEEWWAEHGGDAAIELSEEIE